MREDGRACVVDCDLAWRANAVLFVFEKCQRFWMERSNSSDEQVIELEDKDEDQAKCG